MVKSKENLVGAYAFLIGVILAIFFGVFSNSLEQAGDLFYIALIIIGLIVGFANAGDKSSTTFLLASISIVIVSNLGNAPLIYIAQDNVAATILRNILGSLLVLFVPATIVVALKTVFAQTKI